MIQCSTVEYLLSFTGLPPKNVASRGPNRAVSLFETIEAIIYRHDRGDIWFPYNRLDRLKKRYCTVWASRGNILWRESCKTKRKVPKVIY